MLATACYVTHCTKHAVISDTPFDVLIHALQLGLYFYSNPNIVEDIFSLNCEIRLIATGLGKCK